MESFTISNEKDSMRHLLLFFIILATVILIPNADLKGTLFDTVNVAGEGYIDLSCKNNQICN